MTLLLLASLLAQAASPAPSLSPAPSPTPAPSSSPAARKANMTMPKGWVRVQGDLVARFVFQSPDGVQDIRVAPAAASPALDGEGGVKMAQQLLAHFPWQSTVTEGTACNGQQPAVRSVAKDTKGQTVMEQLIVNGQTGAAIVTYEVRDGKPRPEAEAALDSICIP